MWKLRAQNVKFYEFLLLSLDFKLHRRQSGGAQNSTSFTTELWKITVLSLYHHILEASKRRSVDSKETMLEGAAIKQLLKSKLLFKKIANFTGKLLQNYRYLECEVFRILLKHVGNHLSVLFQCSLFYDRGSYHIESSPLICFANQWTGSYMVGTSVMKELNRNVFRTMSKHLWSSFF